MKMVTKVGAPVIVLLAAMVGVSSAPSAGTSRGAILTCATSVLETGHPLGGIQR